MSSIQGLRAGLSQVSQLRSLDTVEEEVAKLRQLQGLRLPYALLTPLSTRYLQRLKLRVVAETLHELRRHPDPIHIPPD
jgi:hypothetical protein